MGKVRGGTGEAKGREGNVKLTKLLDAAAPPTMIGRIG